MSVEQRQYVGFEVRCDARGCHATTAVQAPRSYVRTRELAIRAATLLLWVPFRLAGREQWVCPLHQRYDARIRQWVPKPRITR